MGGFQFDCFLIVNAGILILIIFLGILIYLIFKRIDEKKEEKFKDRDN